MKSQQVVFLSDIHFPYHDPEAWAVTLKIVEALKPTGVFLGGDIVDFYPLSPFDKDPHRELQLGYDIGVTFDCLVSLKEAAPDAWIKYLPGNHEAWLRKTGWKKYKALSRNLDLPALFRFFDKDLKHLEVKWLPEGALHQIGELFFAHGHEFGIRNTSHPARTTIQRAPGNILFGHWHVEDVSYMRLLNGKFYGAWANPCLSTLDPDYTLNPQWTQGLSRVDFVPSGAFHVDIIPIFTREGTKCAVVDRQFYSSHNVKK